MCNHLPTRSYHSSMGIDIADELHVALRSESFNFIVLIKYKDLFIF